MFILNGKYTSALITNDNTESNIVNVIGVQQILNSLYTHGTCIVNSIVNATYQHYIRLHQSSSHDCCYHQNQTRLKVVVGDNLA